MKLSLGSKIALALYFTLALSSLFLLAVPGGYVPVYALMCIAGAGLAIDAKRSARLLGIGLVTAAAALVIIDWTRGLGEQSRLFHALSAPKITLEPKSPTTNVTGSGVLWRDLNGDGIFDELIVSTERNDLLNLDNGLYILVNGQWTRAEHNEEIAPADFRVGPTLYRFNATSGRWVVSKN